MAESRAAHGHCLCGKIQIEVAHQNLQVGACHCSMCRRWGGGPYLAVDCGTEVRLSGEQEISVYDSSEWAERGFCRHCGSHLFYRFKETGQYIMSAGLFEESGDLIFHQQIFIDEKPHWYQFKNDTEDLTGAEVFAKYAPPQ